MVPRPTAAEVLELEAYPDAVWSLSPTQSGKLDVATGRGGPFKIDWEVHGTGDIKLVWILGLGSVKTGWQRQTLEFGHHEADKYSSLIFDNRGMGKSDKPVMRYSTSEMAQDIIELLDHLGWTSPRELNVSGVSMGGMIGQELGLLIPSRINSLNLISTAAYIENTTTWFENLLTRISMFIPKSLDRSLHDSALSLFAASWLDSPDDTIVPSPSTSPDVQFPPRGHYLTYSTNFARFAATELTKKLDTTQFTRLGFILQAIAAGWHYKSPAQLKELGDKVGRERIAVWHGMEDRMISVLHGEKLAAWLEPGRVEIVEGRGHVFMLEEWKWHNDVVKEGIKKGMGINEQDRRK
ncbi:Alpha/Beta hydrolase protein [Amylocarpus encephaloides]|uniref:Alpha/Beta hydrolase protein n=1 Tax=Amylocarpus encephaloides TaxID=45428 RepID=A0A9P7YP60_9HELO|nr:Alpha/Beta hydrolase protein [Amylocarpus encephaloides]